MDRRRQRAPTAAAAAGAATTTTAVVDDLDGRHFGTLVSDDRVETEKTVHIEKRKVNTFPTISTHRSIIFNGSMN